jgi:hypothetical protein
LEITKGERTASATEAQLDALESKLDALLAATEKEQESKPTQYTLNGKGADKSE